MNVNMVRKIRDKTSLEIVNMTADELHDYFNKNASKIEQRILDIRKKSNL